MQVLTSHVLLTGVQLRLRQGMVSTAGTVAATAHSTVGVIRKGKWPGKTGTTRVLETRGVPKRTHTRTNLPKHGPRPVQRQRRKGANNRPAARVLARIAGKTVTLIAHALIATTCLARRRQSHRFQMQHPSRLDHCDVGANESAPPRVQLVCLLRRRRCTRSYPIRLICLMWRVRHFGGSKLVHGGEMPQRAAHRQPTVQGPATAVVAEEKAVTT
jgi:hypothetical protein